MIDEMGSKGMTLGIAAFEIPHEGAIPIALQP
jgi:hypothetical protein